MPIPDLSNLQLLVVDDSPHMQRLIVVMLNALGIRKVRCAFDGNEALTVIMEFTPDIIITDGEMKPMGGIEMARTLRSTSAFGVQDVPIIMVTGHTERRWVEMARDVGVNHFLAKPISAESLYARLTSVILDPQPKFKAGAQEPAASAVKDGEKVFL